jgi:hypothetical protein
MLLLSGFEASRHLTPAGRCCRRVSISFSSLLVATCTGGGGLKYCTETEWALSYGKIPVTEGQSCSITHASLTQMASAQTLSSAQTTGALKSVCLWGQYFVGEWILVGEGCEESIVFAVGDSKAAEAYEVLKTYPIKAARH